MVASSSIGKSVANVLYFLSILGFFVLLSLTYYFMSYMPVQPNPDLGLICPFNIHGYIVYITDFQCTLVNVLFWGFFVFCPIVVVFKQKHYKQ